MAAKNDITGDLIQTKTFSKQGRENWENIFRKTYKQWAQLLYGNDPEHIIDPSDGGTMSKSEFQQMYIYE